MEVLSKITHSTSHSLHLHNHHTSNTADLDSASTPTDSTTIAMEDAGTVPRRDLRKSTVSSVGASSISQSSLNSQGQPQWRTVRALPTWVHAREAFDESDTLVPATPPPAAKGATKSIHDNKRENIPVTMGPQVDGGSRWRAFVEASSYPSRPGTHSEKVSPEWLTEHTHGDLSSPWLAKPKGDDEEQGGDGGVVDDILNHVSAKRRRIWYKRAQIMLLNNPMVPLTFRAMIWILSVCALALAGSIFHDSDEYGWENRPSTYMAIIVDAVAFVYLIYITYDEYSSKPLGLRSAKAKMRLIMFDLLFIIFDSANLSLAFDSLYDTRGSCATNDPSGSASTPGQNFPICARQRALTAFLFLALTGWCATFTISIFRLVERVSRNAS